MAKEIEEYSETLAKQGFETYTIANIRSVQTKGQDIKNALLFRSAEPIPLAVAIKDGNMFLMHLRVKGFFKAKYIVPQGNIDGAIMISREEVISAKRIKAKRPFNSQCSKYDHIQLETNAGVLLQFYLFGKDDEKLFQCFSKWNVPIDG